MRVTVRVHSCVCGFERWFAVTVRAERMLAKSMPVRRRIRILIGTLLAASLLAPASASAHGALNPVASNYLARIKHVPAGMRASVVDGDLSLWLQVPAGESVLVLDYEGAPYLRFADGHIWANQNSQMAYFNQLPPATPPSDLRSTTPPRWLRVGSGYTYAWHDGRLHAFALESVAPGSSYVGSWRIPVIVNGRREALSGTLSYHGAPSIAWLWPGVVLVLCVLAGWRLQDPRLDATVARAVGAVTLVGIALAAIGRDLHGRPGLSGFGVVELAVIVTLSAWAAARLIRDRAGVVTLCVIVIAALWEGITLIPTLFYGYVLLAVPATLGRLAAIACLGGAIALALPTVRLYRRELAQEQPLEYVDAS